MLKYLSAEYFIIQYFITQNCILILKLRRHIELHVGVNIFAMKLAMFPDSIHQAVEKKWPIYQETIHIVGMRLMCIHLEMEQQNGKEKWQSVSTLQ